MEKLIIIFIMIISSIFLFFVIIGRNPILTCDKLAEDDYNISDPICFDSDVFFIGEHSCSCFASTRNPCIATEQITKNTISCSKYKYSEDEMHVRRITHVDFIRKGWFD